MGRWVCLRCFEPSDDSLSACASCGLPRGTQPSPDDPAVRAAAVPDGGGRGTLLSMAARFWWVAPIAVVAIGGFLFNAQRDDDGQVSRAGDMVVSDLRVGDCYDLKDETAEEVDNVTAKPCSQPHEYELMFIGDVQADGYPTDEEFFAWLDQKCVPAFASYVGTTYESSSLEIAWFSPTEEGWDDGDHAVQCAVYDPSDAEVAGALRNSNR